MASTEPRLIVAMDFSDVDECLALARQLDPKLCRLKVGKELFTAVGPAVVESLQDLGFDVFLDLKFHDIPNTVAGAIRSACRLGVWMVNVHALGGQRMMQSACDALSEVSGTPPLLIAVTLLTSHAPGDLAALGLSSSIDTHVYQLAQLSKNSGMQGVVCSAREVAIMKERYGNDFLCITPGIRPVTQGFGSSTTQSALDDQVRTMTPRDALLAGSDYIVVGRPITQSTHPHQVVEQIADSIVGLEAGR